MEKYENIINKKKMKNIMFLACLFLVVMTASFLITNKIFGKKNAAAASHPPVKKMDKRLMDKRESLSPDKILSSNESPGEYQPWLAQKNSNKKIAYLTFDDGPSPNNTPKVLDILKQNHIKATFFLIGKNAENNKQLVKEELSKGNVVGNHTYNHELNYREGPQVFVDDVNRCDGVLKSIIGKNYNLKLLRFPGGSWSSPHLNLEPFRDAISKAGYHFVNWNDLTGDAEHNNVPPDVLVNRVIKETGNKKIVVILMHDAAAKTTSVEALPQVIQFLKSKGYTFDTLK